MEVKILQAHDRSLLESIKSSLEWCHTANFGVSYANYQAFLIIRDNLEIFLRRNGKLRVLFDIEKFITDRVIIEELATIPGDSECKIFLRPKVKKTSHDSGNFHPKLYLFFNDQKFNAIIGSSNFTLGGIRNNIECNLNMSGEKNHTFAEIERYFSEIWNSEFSLNILNHSDLLEEYSALFKKGQNQDRLKANKLAKLQEKLDDKIDRIIQTREEVLNEEFAYLLGLISANSEIDYEKMLLKIDLFRQVFNKGKEYEGYYFNPGISDYKISQYDAHKKDVDRIIEKLEELIKLFKTADQVGSEYLGGYHFKIYLRFDADSKIFSELKKYDFFISRGKILPFVPENIINSNNKKIIMSFLRGYCDLKSRISLSDGIYKQEKGKRIVSSLRMGISISHQTPKLVAVFKKLFEKIGVTKGVSYSDPKKRKVREFLVRIDVRYVPYALLGTHWKRIFLKDFIRYLDQISKKSHSQESIQIE